MAEDSMNELARRIHEWARSKGFYDRERITVRDPVLGDVEARAVNPSLQAEKLLLIVSEVTEVLSALRDGDTVAEAEEIADILIRVLDYAEWRGIDLDHEVKRKMTINAGRAYLHGRTF